MSYLLVDVALGLDGSVQMGIMSPIIIVVLVVKVIFIVRFVIVVLSKEERTTTQNMLDVRSTFDICYGFILCRRCACSTIEQSLVNCGTR